MADDLIIATHESAHATIARRLDIDVIRVSAGEDDAYVRTRSRYGGSVGQKLAALERLIVVDLAGAAAERQREASCADEMNALNKAARVILLREGSQEDALLDRRTARRGSRIGRASAPRGRADGSGKLGGNREGSASVLSQG